MAEANIVNGLKVPTLVEQKKIDKIKHIQLYEDDVWILGSFKCGTHWMAQIVRLLLNVGGDRLTTSVLWLDGSPGHKVGGVCTDSYTSLDVQPEDVARPRIFKSHFTYETLPCGPPSTVPGKYIYVARNPKDRIISNYFMLKIYFPHFTWDDFFEKEVAGELFYGDYFDHVLGFWKHRDDENILFMKYEDMKKDLGREIQRVASFINADVTADTISRVTEMTTFKNMKADNTANFSWDKAYDKDGEPTFLRKGIVGDWKNYMNPEQSAKIDAICAERLKPEGLEFQFD